ncbi:MAG: DUF1998 domain-containing protein [bacterium]
MITKRYPATFASFLVGGGIWHYEEGDYWSFTNTYLEIERDDLNGCLYSEVLGTPTLILFDDVPGGAGHVRRVAEEECLREVLNAAHSRLARCTCGGKEEKSSCYSCLRHYQNQFCHDGLERGPVIHFLKKLLS